MKILIDKQRRASLNKKRIRQAVLMPEAALGTLLRRFLFGYILGLEMTQSFLGLAS